MKGLPTVTVAFCAYNEKHNVARLLESILAQKRDGYVFKKILVVSDGSQDDTAPIVEQIAKKHRIIQFINSRKRLGKSTHLNTIYRSVSTDFLVQTDADVIWNDDIITRIIAPMIANPATGMCGGNPKPLPAATFVERAVNATTDVYQPLRKQVRGGKNVFSADGRLLAYRNELIKKITVPTDMMANDMYTYFACLSLGYEYTFVPDAVVFYRSPQTLRDQIRQNTRFLAARIRMKRYFPASLLTRELRVPEALLYKKMFSAFYKHPIETAYIYAINKYCSLKAIKQEKILTGAWPMATTTKFLKNSESRAHPEGVFS